MKETKEQLTSIGEMAKKLEMSQRTIRYYEEIGLLNSIKRIEGGRRVYTDADLRRLKLIKSARDFVDHEGKPLNHAPGAVREKEHEDDDLSF